MSRCGVSSCQKNPPKKCPKINPGLKGLDNTKEYIFRVRAENVHGQSEPSRVSEPVSFSNNPNGGSSGASEDEDKAEGAGAGSDKSDSAGEGTATTGEATTEEEENLDHDPSFDAPFKHRNVLMDEGTVFKQKYEIYEELGRGR